MNLVGKEELVGFRPPTMAEKEKIAKYMKRSFRGSLRTVSFWNTAVSVFAAGLLISLMTEFKEKSPGENLLYLVLFVGFAAAAFFTRFHRKMKKQILRWIDSGQYQVMECRAYDVSFSTDLMSRAIVKIYNVQGQYCSSNFLTDLGIAKKYGKDKNTKLLLLKCGGNFYELLNE